MKTILFSLSIGLLIGAGAMFLGARFLGTEYVAYQGDMNSDSSTSNGEKKPLYWVAPMDPNYRRDKPGKSPMGMDLIPVYEDGDAEDSPGTIAISPDVVNNLGVRTAVVKHRAFHSEIETVGYVQYDEDKLIHIHPRVEGWIEKLYVKASGDPVEKGQPLYALYSPQLVNAQEEYLLALKRNNARLRQAAENRLRALQFEDAAIDTLRKTQQVMQTTTFHAPHSGVVDNLNIREGFFVKPGTTLMSVGNLDQVWVEAEVFERQAALVKAGLPVVMTLDYLPGEQWQGQVSYVYPTLDPKTRTARVRLRFDNDNHLLKPNMFAQVTISSGPITQSGSAKGSGVFQESLLVPREAVIRTGQQDRVVLALGEGRFKSVAVETGRKNQAFIEILSGLEAGEKVVISAQFLLDSESSKTSDFRRLHHGDEQPTSVWTSGEVKAVMTSQRMMTASHEPIEAWDWPAMTMDFSVADSVEMDSLEPSAALHMEISKTGDNAYEITAIHIQETASSATATAEVNGVINHINQKARTLNISREAIEKWNRPPATMDFSVAKDIELNEFHTGEKIFFRFNVVNGEFTIDRIEHVDHAAPNSNANHDPHSQGHHHHGESTLEQPNSEGQP